MKKEQIRHQMSALLMDTNEQQPLKCYIQIGESEAVGLGSLELPTVVEVFQQPEEGIIWFKLEGCEELIEFDDLSKRDLETILEYLK